LTVASLGAVTPSPGALWEVYSGPGSNGDLGTDAHACYIPHTENWISYLEVGAINSAYLPYDPAERQGSAGEAMDTWTSGFAFGSAGGLEVSETTIADVEVDGRPGVLAETTVAWTASEHTPDRYEDIAILMVAVDGVNGFLG